MPLPHLVKELGDQPAPRSADHAEADRADDLGPQCSHVGYQRLELVGDPAGPLDDDLTLFGQAARRTVDEHHIQLALEAGDVRRDVGLHRADGGGGGREAAGVRDAQKCLQVFQFHRALPPGMLAGVLLPISINDRKYLLQLLD